jgi:hypothetical protein
MFCLGLSVSATQNGRPFFSSWKIIFIGGEKKFWVMF